MIENTSGLLNGSMVIAALAYAGLSGWVTGPLVAERTIENMGWEQSCTLSVQQDIVNRQPTNNFEPRVSCDNLFGHFPNEHKQLLDFFGMGAACSMMDQLNNQRDKLEELKRNRIKAAAAEANDKCACAVNTLIENKRTSIALYAGSARLLKPATFKNLEAELKASLNTPSCSQLGKY